MADGRVRLPVDRSYDNGEINGCDTSPAANAPNIYTCGATAADLPACWVDPAPSSMMFCMHSPTDTKVVQIVKPNADNMFKSQSNTETGPWTVTLDDGTVCVVRLGGAWNAPPKGYDETYGCRGPVQILLSPKNGSLFDKSAAQWRVHASTSMANNPPVIVIGVTSVVYAGAAPTVAPAQKGASCPSAAQLQSGLTKGLTINKTASDIYCEGSWARATIDDEGGNAEPAAFQFIGGRWQMPKVNVCTQPGPLPAVLYPGVCDVS